MTQTLNYWTRGDVAFGGKWEILDSKTLSTICHVDMGNLEAESNAILMASAPELYDALTHAYDIIHSIDPLHKSLELIENAISKAEGK